MTYPLTIYQAGVPELATIEDLARQIWPDTYKDILSPEQISYMMNLIYSRASLTDQLVKQQHTFLIAGLDKIPVGFASYSPVDLPGTWKLHKIYVHAGTRGKGIGKIFIEHIAENIRLKGGTVLRLNVNRYNIAQRFYEKLGFTVIKEEDIDIGNNYFMNDYVMEKSL